MTVGLADAATREVLYHRKLKRGKSSVKVAEEYTFENGKVLEGIGFKYNFILKWLDSALLAATAADLFDYLWDIDFKECFCMEYTYSYKCGDVAKIAAFLENHGFDSTEVLPPPERVVSPCLLLAHDLRIANGISGYARRDAGTGRSGPGLPDICKFKLERM